MIKMSVQDVLHEPVLVKYLSSNKAIYCLNKCSLDYRALKLWCHLYHRPIDLLPNVTQQNYNYMYFKAGVPLTPESFSKNVLNNQLGINEKGNATPKFVHYLNKRYKALYTREVFSIVQTVDKYMRCPFAHSNKFYLKLRIKALMQNMEDGVLNINYDYDPLDDPNQPFPGHLSKGQKLLDRAYQYPYEQISKNSFLIPLMNQWFATRGTTLRKSVRGLNEDKHYIYFGMSNIPRRNMWKFKHPNHYSNIDYFLLGGSGDGTLVKKFIQFIRN